MPQLVLGWGNYAFLLPRRLACQLLSRCMRLTLQIQDVVGLLILNASHSALQDRKRSQADVLILCIAAASILYSSPRMSWRGLSVALISQQLPQQAGTGTWH